jgi:hypothetical protein
MIFLLAAAAAEKIPDLRPPLGPVAPGLWEQPTTWWALLGVLFILADIAAWIWWANQKGKPVALPPAQQARATLNRLLNAPPAAALAAEVSREVRRYATAAIGRAGEELTSEELTRAIGAEPRLDATHVRQLSELLRDCDRQKFAPAAEPAPHLAERGLKLVDAFEQLLQPAPEDA